MNEIGITGESVSTFRNDYLLNHLVELGTPPDAIGSSRDLIRLNPLELRNLIKDVGKDVFNKGLLYNVSVPENINNPFFIITTPKSGTSSAIKLQGNKSIGLMFKSAEKDSFGNENTESVKPGLAIVKDDENNPLVYVLRENIKRKGGFLGIGSMREVSGYYLWVAPDVDIRTSIDAKEVTDLDTKEREKKVDTLDCIVDYSARSKKIREDRKKGLAVFVDRNKSKDFVSLRKNNKDDQEIYKMLNADEISGIESTWEIGKYLGKGSSGKAFWLRNKKDNNLAVLKIAYGLGDADDLYKKTSLKKALEKNAVEYENLINLRHSFISKTKISEGEIFKLIPNVHKLSPDNKYLIMRYIDGQTVEKYVRRNGGCLSQLEFAKILEDVSRVFAFLEENGKYFADMHSDDVMIRKSQDGDIGAAMVDWNVLGRINPSTETDKKISENMPFEFMQNALAEKILSRVYGLRLPKRGSVKLSSLMSDLKYKTLPLFQRVMFMSMLSDPSDRVKALSTYKNIVSTSAILPSMYESNNECFSTTTLIDDVSRAINSPAVISEDKLNGMSGIYPSIYVLEAKNELGVLNNDEIKSLHTLMNDLVEKGMWFGRYDLYLLQHNIRTQNYDGFNEMADEVFEKTGMSLVLNMKKLVRLLEDNNDISNDVVNTFIKGMNLLYENPIKAQHYWNNTRKKLSAESDGIKKVIDDIYAESKFRLFSEYSYLSEKKLDDLVSEFNSTVDDKQIKVTVFSEVGLEEKRSRVKKNDIVRDLVRIYNDVIENDNLSDNVKGERKADFMKIFHKGFDTSIHSSRLLGQLFTFSGEFYEDEILTYSDAFGKMTDKREIFEKKMNSSDELFNQAMKEIDANRIEKDVVHEIVSELSEMNKYGRINKYKLIVFSNYIQEKYPDTELSSVVKNYMDDLMSLWNKKEE